MPSVLTTTALLLALGQMPDGTALPVGPATAYPEQMVPQPYAGGYQGPAGAYNVEGGLQDRGGWHLMGTARMGNDPATSVVNAWGRSHDVRNLFIVDGSIFITSAGVNPTHTIQALALYIADQIKQRLATLFD